MDSKQTLRITLGFHAGLSFTQAVNWWLLGYFKPQDSWRFFGRGMLVAFGFAGVIGMLDDLLDKQYRQEKALAVQPGPQENHAYEFYRKEAYIAGLHHQNLLAMFIYLTCMSALMTASLLDPDTKEIKGAPIVIALLSLILSMVVSITENYFFLDRSFVYQKDLTLTRWQKFFTPLITPFPARFMGLVGNLVCCVLFMIAISMNQNYSSFDLNLMRQNVGWAAFGVNLFMTIHALYWAVVRHNDLNLPEYIRARIAPPGTGQTAEVAHHGRNHSQDSQGDAGGTGEIFTIG